MQELAKNEAESMKNISALKSAEEGMAMLKSH